jgi:hypothetical protein
MELGSVAQYGALAISVLALLRPDISRSLRRWTSQIKLNLHPRLEIGFTTFGHALGLYGSIEAEPHDRTIVNMNLSLRNLQEEKIRKFHWNFIRPPKLHIENEVKEFELAAPFTVKRGDAKSFSIQFLDSLSTKHCEEVMIRYRSILDPYMAQSAKKNIRPAEALKQFEKLHPGMGVAAKQEIESAFYWKSGPYLVEVQITSGYPEKSHNFKYKFELSELQSANLAQNINIMWGGLHGAEEGKLNYTFSPIRNVK